MHNENILNIMKGMTIESSTKKKSEAIDMDQIINLLNRRFQKEVTNA